MLRKKGLSTLTGSYLLPEVALPRFRLTPEIHMYKNAGLGHIPINPTHLQLVRPAYCSS